MHPISGHCHPSSSGLLGNLEEKMTKNIDKVTDRLKKKLNPKKGSIFVPSSSAANGTPERPLPRSTSHFEPTANHLSPNSIDQRRQSAPSPVGRGPALMPPPLPPHKNSMNQAPPPPIGFLPLSIDTFGGECAGSGYGWIHEDGQTEVADEINSSHLQAQKLSLTMVQQKLASVDQILSQVQKDNQVLNDFIASTFAAQIANPDRLDMAKMNDRIESLRSEIDNLRRLSPRSVPPERPPRPNSQMWWSCPLCAEHCPMYDFRCKRCAFPRPEIDPNEFVYCSCSSCLNAVAERLFVSVTPEDDWMMVNRLNHPVKK